MRSVNSETPKEVTKHEDSDQGQRKAFRFYIYDIPELLNKNITHCKFVQPFMCVDFQDRGFGSETFIDGFGEEISFRATSMFSIEMIIHNKLKTNRLRTYNPDEADLFYVPAYFGLLELCYKETTRKKFQVLRELFTNNVYFSSGKPHISTLGLLYVWMPPDVNLGAHFKKNGKQMLTFLTLESVQIESMDPLSEIVIPYPSYGHFLHSMERTLYTNPLQSRNIYILLPIGEQYYEHSKRRQLLTDVTTYTDLSYDYFMKEHINMTFDRVHYITRECPQVITQHVIQWMQHSVFCLQPRGDTDSRKSFYDSLMSGCIPVMIPKSTNPYAFQNLIDYEQFSVILPFSYIDIDTESIYDILYDIPRYKVISLHSNVRKIAQYLQYSVSDNEEVKEESDALQLIFMALSDRFKLPYDKKHLYNLHINHDNQYL
ncbi:MUR3 [Mytilus coruscus]|uniref:MUR3 n=1 Tax=Mytilus coruscus TaxID=42192 RepID=A0A6J8DRM6_MYTCO|nr:MUR3 [Mytilus coruscus]